MGNKSNRYTANLDANDPASLCFKNSSRIRYVVRTELTLPGDAVNIPGTLTVGDGDWSSVRKPTSQPMTQNDEQRMRKAAQADEPIQNQ